MIVRIGSRAACLTAFLVVVPGARAQGVSPEEVDRAIVRGAQAVLEAMQEDWTLVARDKAGKTWTFRGEVISKTGGKLKFRTRGGTRHTVARKRVVLLTPPGAHSGEMTGTHRGGPTALAVFALLSAGVPADDPKLRLSLQYLAEADLPGTYSRALRAAAWSLLSVSGSPPNERRKYRNLLRSDTRWLVAAMDGRGWYTYTRFEDKPRHDRLGDHSCTQFGVLGAWACAEANVEIPRSYWETTRDHWLAEQAENGGWAYGRGYRPDTETMTTAGINSLYVVLDQLYAQSGGKYRRFRGIRRSEKLRAEELEVLAAIDKGLARLHSYGKGGDRRAGRGWGYRQFGLERLGRASGLKYLGGRDWYREGANDAARRPWTGSSPEDAFRLIFLVYGRAAVLFNKLALGDQSSWNYYTRDLHSLCRFLTRRYERLVRWQIVSLDQPADDLMDAPILYLNGTVALHLAPEEREKLREYCERGGTIIGHADLASEAFSHSFRQVFSAMYGERGWKFERLSAEHPVYGSAGRSEPELAKIPLEGMSDGERTFIFLFPVDIAGAWQRNLIASQEDLFLVMANIRHYAVPPR